jgi:hypothetical protein
MDIYFGRERHNSISIRINIRPEGSPGIESFANGADGFGAWCGRRLRRSTSTTGELADQDVPALDLNDR